MIKRKSTRRRHLVEALRSGKYTQGQNALESVSPQRNCCLGVACRVAMKDGLDLPVRADGAVVRFDGAVGVLPHSVMDWYGFMMRSGDYGGYVGCSLVDDNDRSRLTFEQIADIIESEPAGLFTD